MSGMRTSRMSLACAVVALCGCNAVLGIESDYVEGTGDASVAQHIERTPGVSGQSCKGGLTCGKNLSCCHSEELPPGSYTMGCTEPNPEEDCDYDEPPHPAVVSGFKLDAFEVSVGRFRKFADAFGAGWRPMDGAGAHPAIDGSGWRLSWEKKLPKDRDELIEVLKCITFNHTWSDEVTTNEQYPLNCVNWYEAFAFCIWDGGRLPTEAEWEYAAKGGSEHRTWPWGSQEPDCTLANIGGCTDADGGAVDPTPDIPVGSRTGVARWGQYDMAGGLWEWAFDTYDEAWYEGDGKNCENCANTMQGPRVDRGGSFYESDGYSLRGSYRGKDFPENRNDWLGFRCARDDS